MVVQKKKIQLFQPHPIMDTLLNCPTDICIQQGGTNSGKTYTILEFLILKAIETPDTIVTVVAQDVPNLKKGAYRDMKMILKDHPDIREYFLVSGKQGHNKGEREFRFLNGSIMEFTSFADAQDASGGKRQYCFINEAPGVDYEIFKELYIRTDIMMIIDYNPTAEFWVHKDLIGRADVTRYITNFTHNPYLKKKTLRKILAYKENDPWRWKVYGLGKTGQVEGVVVKKFRVVPEFPEACKRVVYGLDFGFVNDPTAFIKVGFLHGEVFGKELGYATGMLTEDIVEMFLLNHIRPTRKGHAGDIIIADNAEARTIKELQNYGYNVVPCDKGQGSINAGVVLINKFWINVTHDSKNWIMEQRNYVYKKLKSTGEWTNDPIDKFNHCWDPLRYVLDKYYGKKKKKHKTKNRSTAI